MTTSRTAENGNNGKKRAICLAGGGPAAGLHIGVLKCLEEKGIDFEVWALSCIGAWVGVVYNQFDRGIQSRADQTYNFFRNSVFREDVSYSRFPINTVFGPDWFGNARAVQQFLTNPASYENLVLPDRIMDSVRHSLSFLSNPKNWTNEGDVNQWLLNHVMAVNPFVRFWTSLMYLSNIDGLSQIYYPESNFMKAIKFDELYRQGKPYIFHNAWNLTDKQLQLFCNDTTGRYRDDNNRPYKPITAASLCACSALPFVEETVKIDGATYCEGALIDTVNFERLIKDHHHPHPDPEQDDSLHEIWISRIVDAQQVREPKNLHDALANLCQLFAATVGEDDVRLFKYHVRIDNMWRGTIIEIRVDSKIKFDWSHENLKLGRARGYEAADEAYQKYMAGSRPEPALIPGPSSVTIIE